MNSGPEADGDARNFALLLFAVVVAAPADFMQCVEDIVPTVDTGRIRRTRNRGKVEMFKLVGATSSAVVAAALSPTQL